jgi:ketosteroid isomerase-like protein
MSVPDADFSPDDGQANAASRTPRDVLSLYHRALRTRSADQLAELYAADAVHEFSVPVAHRPPVCHGREAVRAAYSTAWAKDPVVIDSLENTFVRQANDDPEVVIGQWQVRGTLRTTGERVNVNGLLFLQVRDGFIVHARDFLDGLEAALAKVA